MLKDSVLTFQIERSVYLNKRPLKGSWKSSLSEPAGRVWRISLSEGRLVERSDDSWNPAASREI
ncbi:MAG: hypothetical protein PHU68_05640 [Paludibacter sp.]|nr:hypothetical protein [Paludibacter sp.]